MRATVAIQTLAFIALTVAAAEPARAQATVEMGNALFAQGRTREAVGVFDAVLQANPNAVAAWLGRGKALNALGDVNGALVSYGAALQRGAGGMPNLRAWIAELYLAAGDQGRAEAALVDELRLVPRSAWAQSWLGTLRLLQQRDAEAGQALAAAMWLDPQVIGQRYGNGLGLYNAGQPGRAWLDFRTVVAMNPQDANAYYALGMVYKQTRSPAAAIQAFQAFLQHNPPPDWAQRARQEMAGLQPQAPVPDPSGYPAWLRSNSPVPPAVPGPGPVSESPGPGPAVPPSTSPGSATGYTGSVCPAETRVANAAAIQKVMQESYTKFVELSRQRNPNDPEIKKQLERYQCARATLQALRQTTPSPGSER